MTFYNLRPHNLLLVWALSCVPVALCACYDPNGKETTMDDFFACSQPDTICCALGRNNPAGADIALGATKDECLPNGLCENRYLENGSPVQTWWRTFCTDSTFNSTNCINACTTDDVAEKFGNRRMTPCDGTRNSERWCCGETKDCCTPDDNPDAIVLAATIGQSTSSATSTPSSTPTSSNAPTTTSSNDPMFTGGSNPDNSGLTTGAKAGIGVGAAVGAIALLGIGAVFIVRSRRRKSGQKVKGPGMHEMASDEPPQYQNQKFAHQVEPTPVAELPAQMTQHELPAGR